MSDIKEGKKEENFPNGYCHKCDIRERKSYYLKSEADSLCYKCYKISEFCVSCFKEYHTDGYLCDICYDKWSDGTITICPYCKESECETHKGDSAKLCSRNNLYTETSEFNSLFNFVYCKYLKNESKENKKI